MHGRDEGVRNTDAVGAVLNPDGLRDTVCCTELARDRGRDGHPLDLCPIVVRQVPVRGVVVVREQGGERGLATVDPRVHEVGQVDEMMMSIDDVHLTQHISVVDGGPGNWSSAARVVGVDR